MDGKEEDKGSVCVDVDLNGGEGEGEKRSSATMSEDVLVKEKASSRPPSRKKKDTLEEALAVARREFHEQDKVVKRLKSKERVGPATKADALEILQVIHDIAGSAGNLMRAVANQR